MEQSNDTPRTSLSLKAAPPEPMNLVFLSSVEFDSLQPVLQTLIEESAEFGRTILATPRGRPSNLPDGVEARAVLVDRPLELQPDTDWLSAAGKNLIVALSVSAEPATISYRFPIAWIEPIESPLPTFRATSLAHRSALVSGPKTLKDQYNIPSERFVEINALTADRLRTAGAFLVAYQPPSRYHAVLSAESFMRYEVGRSLLENIPGISMYKQSRTAGRLDLAIHSDLSDSDRLLKVTEGIDLEVEKFAPDILRRFSALQSCESLEQVVDSELSSRFDDLTSTEQRMVVLQALARLRADVSPGSRAVQLLRGQIERSVLYRLLSSQDVSRFSEDPLTPFAFLQNIQQYGQPLAATTAEVEFLKRLAISGKLWGDEESAQELDIETLRARTEDLIDEIDAASPYPAVWKAACDYWWRMDGSTNSKPPDPLPSPPVPGVVTISNHPLLDDIGDMNRAAAEALAAGQFMVSARLYDVVRALCLLHKPEIPTTEKAARLNAGWALWKGGADRPEWAPYVVSVMYETGTPDHLRVRGTLQSVLAEFTSPDRTSQDHLRSIRMRMSQRTGLDSKQARKLLTGLLSEIDESAGHANLWASGLSYWREMSGGEWTGSPVDPPPPFVSTPESKVDLESIQRLNGRARKAMSRRRWKRAIRLFEDVRGSCRLHDPPVVTTESAARLNIGWALWKLGMPQAKWQPYITSVLQEVGPGPGFADARAEVVRALSSNQVRP